MKILAVGGGSGGHVTPVVAVLRELKSQHPDSEMRFWCDRKFAPQARSIMAHFDASIRVDEIQAGKLQRFHHLSVLRQLFWPALMFSNIKDGFLVIAGFFQSIFKLIVWRPDVVFTKGGYVCLPVGIAARLLNIPLVIHDSDAHPGLTNRVLAKWATSIATGAPLKHYPYPADRSRYVGIPIAAEFKPFSPAEKRKAKQLFNVSPDRPLIVITGGGLGAQRINDAVVDTIAPLQTLGSIILLSGTGNYEELRTHLPENSSDFQLHPFISEHMAELLGGADIVIARAGATTILELAALGTPTILVPNGKLTGGHQLKNAAVYQENGAVEVVDDDQLNEHPELLYTTAKELLATPGHMMAMSAAFHEFSRPDAARDMADMILSAVK